MPETALPFFFEEARSNTSRQLPPGNNRTDGLSWEGVLLSLQRFNSLCTTAACEQFYSYGSVETTAADYRPRDRITGHFHRSGPQARIPHSQVVSAGKCSYTSVDGELRYQMYLSIFGGPCSLPPVKIRDLRAGGMMERTLSKTFCSRSYHRFSSTTRYLSGGLWGGTFQQSAP